MDPLTITSTVLGISARCITSARALYELREKYKDASMTITAIYSETNVLSTSLAHIQGLCTRNPEALRTTLQEQPQLEATFDQALTGCVLVYSVLDEEIRRLYEGIRQEGVAGAMGRMKFLWKEEAMKDVLMQIRGQQAGLSLLIQALQMSSIHEIRTLIQANMGTMQNAAQRLGQFRNANAQVKAPRSIFENAFDDVASLYSVDSAATSTNFIFDDVVVNSQAYRRALAQSRSSVALGTLVEQSETSSDADTIVDTPLSRTASKYSLPPTLGRRLSPAESVILQDWIEKVSEDASGKQHLAELESLKAEHATLVTKYRNVKRLYFDGQRQKEEQIKEQEMLAAEYSRVVNEKAEFEKENDHLREDADRRAAFFVQHADKRKLLVESHSKELNLKNAKITELEGKVTSENTAFSQLLTRSNEQKATILQLESERDRLQSQGRSLSDSHKNLEDMCDRLKTENEEKELNLQRYKGFEAIIEQLRTLSPAPASPRTPSANQQSLSPGTSPRV
ncbi:hypothetical protein BU24DRAFT_409583 [Aaosphaeria arxii CBS 175.79]|uniref:Fungal N-terminal domain-containing protein n=1 Tax=Aaosphaeria arxii CBS 175.79 TaxID=1450172 RepID=A0A6A5XT29_9PLEO|nr:uncharacterized protein BU24DRAFT_409583 [Aaosphaeria arxii CBS 175.79]KAF2016485.1 hypothetical protein BU24DRAFT_409583 [Aaosphaeria arxii CBS 175.79]